MINFKSTKRKCCEDISKIENYEQAVNDETQVWDCHHRLGVQGQFYNSKELLIRIGMYYDRPANELIFLTRSEHIKLHNYSGERNGMYGHNHSEESKQKIRNHKRTPEHCKKLSEAAKGKTHTAEHKMKIGNAVRGNHWYNNGEIQTMAKSCPPGFKPGRIK